ncbi:MAG: hypothetical protein NVS2B14_09630 [Chamaesiphon sp.]
MRYSLLNRFQGTLLAAALGEIYGSQYKEGRLGAKLRIDSLIYPWSYIALTCTQSFVHCGRLDLEDWVHHPSLLPKIGTASCSEAAIATVPVMLFFHENETILAEQLKLAAATWQGDDLSGMGVLAVGYAIAQALTEKLNPDLLITKTLTYLQNSQTPLVQQLEQVQTLLKQRACLDTAFTYLCRDSHPTSTTPIALAFYCFLSTPEDFRLSLMRAAQTAYQPQTTVALTSILSGVYNSLAGIPLSWRLLLNRTYTCEILHLADRLLGVWSGVYNATTVQLDRQAALAAPGVIQRRDSGL